MIKKISVTSLFLGALAAPLSAWAERPYFSYLEVGAVDMEHQQVTGDFVGYNATASYELKDDFYVVGKFITTEDSDRSLDMGTKSVGIGYHYRVSDNSVITTQLDSVGVIFSRPDAGKFDEQGYQFSLGYKYRLADAIEFQVGVKRLQAGEVDPDYGNFRQDITLVGINYTAFAGLGVFADYQEETNSKQLTFGLRYEY